MAFDREGFERTVAAMLQAVRQKKGLTQDEIAERIGIPRSSYANFEAARQRIPVDILWRAAAVLGVSIVSLVPEPIYRAPVPSAQHAAAEGTNTSGDLHLLGPALMIQES